MDLFSRCKHKQLKAVPVEQICLIPRRFTGPWFHPYLYIAPKHSHPQNMRGPYDLARQFATSFLYHSLKSHTSRSTAPGRSRIERCSNENSESATADFYDLGSGPFNVRVRWPPK